MMSENLLIDYKRYCELFYTAAIIIGANIGTTITAFIVSIPIAEYLIVLI